jgi:predicted nucleic acid-binding Zn ribbon protein
MNDIESRLNTHEAVCAERYNGIWSRLKRLETILITSFGAIIALLVTLVLKGI